MAFVRPTLTEISDRVRADFVSRLALSGAVLRRSMVYVLSAVIAGAAHMLHGHLEYLAAQLFADTAEGQFLARLASLFGLTRTVAAFATGPIQFTGVNGTVVPIGSVLVRADGATYETDAEVTIAAGVAAATVTAVVAAEDGNTDAAVELTLESPIAGIDSAVPVQTGGLTGGADEESDEGLRTRLVARMQDPPNGGSSADYVAWQKEVAGVTRAWVYPAELGVGTVVTRFVRDGETPIIPSAGEVATVQAYLDTKRPVTAVVTVLAPVAVPLDFTIALTPDTSATRAAAEAELTALLADGIPGATTLLSQINVAVGAAEGVTDFAVTVPAADVVHATGELATLGVITWV